MIDNFRSMFARFVQYKGARDLWRAFGYPESVMSDDYWREYRRGGVANRIVKAFPKACWRDGAVVRDDDGAGLKPGEDGFSKFALAWDQLERQHAAFRSMERSDRLARVGQYAVLVMGFQDGMPLSAPMEGQAALTYLAPYAERSVTITQWDTDRRSPRYGLPVVYRVETGGVADRSTSQVVPRSSFTVHHTRVLHIVEDPDDNEVFGEPALRPPWNYLCDLEKVSGAAAETFWLNARGGLAIEAASDAQIDAEGLAAMREQAQEYEDQLRRILAFHGAEVKMLTSSVPSPQYHMEMLQALIAGTTGIPQRILFGSERGELASSQDENSWESRVDERRQQHCGPMILGPFVTRMIETGNLPLPNGDWWVVWPEASAASPEKEADIALKRAQALATYSNSLSEQIVPPSEFRPWLGLEPMPDDDSFTEPPDIETDDDET